MKSYFFFVLFAIHYLTLAAERNYPNAQHNLGCIYDKNNESISDIEKAVHYFTLATNQNQPESAEIIGTYYLKGKYVQKDINKAIHYL